MIFKDIFTKYNTYKISDSAKQEVNHVLTNVGGNCVITCV